MKFVVKVNERQVLLTAPQLEQLVELIDGCEYYVEDYVGENKGTKGSRLSYQPRIKSLDVHEWFHPQVMREDLINTIKLTTKLEDKT